ncbi:hva22-like protein a [Quercus suber]|uniref:HVA22-like protein n=1 Tax=Quercus suber TaxID=58331 RepID=A0AAW0KXJ9_QUESU
MGSGAGSFLKVILKNFDVLAGPVVSLVYPLIPIWPYAKLILTCWLVIPYFSGAAYVYDHYVRPFFVNQQTLNIWYVPKKKDVFSKPDDILSAAEKYIAQNGTDDFKKIINKADKSRSSESYSHIFEDDRY